MHAMGDSRHAIMRKYFLLFIKSCFKREQRSMPKSNKVHNISQFLPTQNINDCSLQHLMKNIIIVAQCFALLPVDGVTKDTEHLRFKWISLKTIYTIFTTVLLTVYTVFVLLYCIANGENFFSYIVLIWNIRGLIGLAILFRLGHKWPRLLQQWSKIETSMLDYGPIPSMKRRLKIISVTFLVVGTSEHFLFISGGVKNALAELGEDEGFMEKYCKNLYGEVFSLVGYSHWKAVLVEFLALVTTVLWQFCDLVIVLLSSALAERLRQVTWKINTKQIIKETQWREIRCSYNNLSLLCRTLNEAISPLVLFSFFGNAFFLSLSVFQCFRPRNLFQSIYFWTGFILTLMHFVSVCLYAAWVSEQSFESIPQLVSVPTKNMCHEVDRILQQMGSGDVAIHGSGFFKVTRSAMLNVINVIVTVQLILVQFNANVEANV